jgi:hypothetical protein
MQTSTYISDRSLEHYWVPHQNLTSPTSSPVTLVFVSALRIQYKKTSTDPIFPADDKVDKHSPPPFWYRNSDWRARPFACLDDIDICFPDGTCHSYYDPPEDSQTKPEIILIWTSLYKTFTFNSITKRLGRALLAQNLVSQYFSEPISDGSDGGTAQWVQEVENLIKTSLARVQINAWSVAVGEDRIHEGLDEFDLYTKGVPNLCDHFKYHPAGYIDIKAVPFFVILGLFPLFWLLSLNLKSIKAFFSMCRNTVKRWVSTATSHANQELAEADAAQQPQNLPTTQEEEGQREGAEPEQSLHGRALQTQRQGEAQAEETRSVQERTVQSQDEQREQPEGRNEQFSSQEEGQAVQQGPAERSQNGQREQHRQDAGQGREEGQTAEIEGCQAQQEEQQQESPNTTPRENQEPLEDQDVSANAPIAWEPLLCTYLFKWIFR